MIRMIPAKGTLKIGRGIETDLCAVTVEADLGPDARTVELLISGTGRHVWVTMDRDSALALAAVIQEKFAP